jgi:uncharacterized membrane protein YraQ (UPF0718 family)
MAGRLNEFAVVFISIVLQSLPFVLVGVFASAVVEHYLSGELVARWLPRRRLPAVLLASMVGFVIPVCDCGVIPLARRLTAKGVPVYVAMTLLIAAPVINPIVLLSTGFAFQGDARVVVLRMAMTLSVAIVVGLAASALFPDARTRLPTLAERLSSTHDHDLNVGPTRWRAIAFHTSREYVEVIFYIVLGALFTAITQTFVPRGDLSTLGAHPLGSVVVLMPIATALSICSEADAFVARAFSSTFSLGAVLAFMTIGQIVDLRNGLLLGRTLGVRLVGLVVAISYPLILTEGALINAVLGR